MRRKLTPNQQEWQKEIRRLQRFMRRAEARGFDFSEVVLPQRPARITQKALFKLKSLTPSVLYEKATYKLPSGETVTGTAGRRYERQQAARKRVHGVQIGINIPEFASVVLDNVIEMIDTWTPDVRWSAELAEIKRGDMGIAQRIITGAINRHGRVEVARRLQDNAMEVMDLINRILYASGNIYKESGRDGIQLDLLRLSQIVNGAVNKSESRRLGEYMSYLEDIDDDE